LNKRYHRPLPEDYLVEERVPYTYEDADLLNDDEALERCIESERFAFREEWFRYVEENE